VKSHYLLSILLPALLVISFLSSCQPAKKESAKEVKPVPTAKEDMSTVLDSLAASQVEEAQAALRTTFNAVRFYRADHTKVPASIEELEEQEYLFIDEESKQIWTFSLVLAGDSLMTIKAVSTTEMEDGAGHEVLFDVRTLRFSGYGD